MAKRQALQRKPTNGGTIECGDRSSVCARAHGVDAAFPVPGADALDQTAECLRESFPGRGSANAPIGKQGRPSGSPSK